MVMVGAGALAPRLIAAHAAVRPIEEVAIWNRIAETRRAPRRRRSTGRDFASRAIEDLAAAVAAADIVSAATHVAASR